MKITIQPSCKNAPKAAIVANYLTDQSDVKLFSLYDGDELSVDAILTHGKKAVALCRKMVKDNQWLHYAVIFEFVSAGNHQIKEIGLYQKAD